LASTTEFEALRPILQVEVQNTRRGSLLRTRRQENVEWVRNLDLTGLSYNKTERQVSIVTTREGEEIAIQYPGKESVQGRKKWKNDWDFRPKLTNRASTDLTFEQIWDPLFDDLRQLSGEKRRQVAAVLATLYYRIAYMVDYRKSQEDRYESRIIQIAESFGDKVPQTLHLGPFWKFDPPLQAVDFVAEEVPKWAGMSFEAFLHYNSLLAWNEDMKCFAKFDDWNAGDPRGRINTLLTYIRVIGFIVDEVRPSVLLGGFARQRGMSMAEPDEVRRICFPFVG
jgi:hypothetical protein